MHNPPQPMVLTKRMIEKHFNVDNYTIYKEAQAMKMFALKTIALRTKWRVYLFWYRTTVSQLVLFSAWDPAHQLFYIVLIDSYRCVS